MAYGACNTCGCAFHECECADSKSSSATPAQNPTFCNRPPLSQTGRPDNSKAWRPSSRSGPPRPT
jgi:hypothetical protein